MYPRTADRGHPNHPAHRAPLAADRPRRTV